MTSQYNFISNNQYFSDPPCIGKFFIKTVLETSIMTSQYTTSSAITNISGSGTLVNLYC